MTDAKAWIVDVGAFEGVEGLRIRQSLMSEAEYPVLFIEADSLNFAKIPVCAGDKKLNIAVGPQDGAADFYRYKSETGSVLPLNYTRLDNYIDGHTGKPAAREDWRLREKTSVSMRRLDSLCIEFDIQKIRFLKIDTQGYDLEVLKSLGDHIGKVDELVCEVQLPGAEIYQGGATKESVLDYLHSKGFLFIRQNFQSFGQELNMYFKRKDLLGGLEKEPLVSVLTPCYQSARFLERCIQSVALQEYPFVEHIIQDGGSTDETLQILEKYKDRVSWVSEKDQGQSDGLNRALQRCKGDIIGVLNADDEYEPHALVWAVENFIKEKSVGVIYGDQSNIDETGKVLFRSSGPNPYDYKKIFCCQAVIPAQAAFVRRSAFEAAGFYIDVTRPTCPDYEQWVRLGLTTKMKYVPGFVARYRIHTGSEGQQAGIIFKMAASKREVVEKFFFAPSTPDEIKKLRREAHSGILEWSAGHFLPPHIVNDRKLAWRQLALAFLSRPTLRLFLRSRFPVAGRW